MDFDFVYLDLDGVLGNFIKSAFKVHNFEQEASQYSLWGLMGITATEFWHKIDEIPDFWNDIEKYEWADELYNYFFERYGKERLRFLSTPNNHHHSYTGKKKWLQRFYPNTKVILAEEKEHLAKYRRLLIDDHDTNIEKWEREGGHGIVFPQPWNQNKHHTDKLAYVKEQYTIKYNVLRYGNTEGIQRI